MSSSIGMRYASHSVCYTLYDAQEKRVKRALSLLPSRLARGGVAKRARRAKRDGGEKSFSGFACAAGPPSSRFGRCRSLACDTSPRLQRGEERTGGNAVAPQGDRNALGSGRFRPVLTWDYAGRMSKAKGYKAQLRDLQI